jgi:hypothetical protein
MAAPLSESTRALARVTATLEATGRQLSESAAALQRPTEGRAAEPEPAEGLPDIAQHLESAHEAVLEALAGLPRASDYEPTARQLREIASVSPSLMEWLREVPALSAPLAESIRALQGAAADLKVARELVRGHAGRSDD